MSASIKSSRSAHASHTSKQPSLEINDMPAMVPTKSTSAPRAWYTTVNASGGTHSSELTNLTFWRSQFGRWSLTWPQWFLRAAALYVSLSRSTSWKAKCELHFRDIANIVATTPCVKHPLQQKTWNSKPETRRLRCHWRRLFAAGRTGAACGVSSSGRVSLCQTPNDRC